MGIKIQINSLEALERLIGGDNELEISIRDNIVQEFTNKYLKGLVNSDKIKEASWSINQKIRNCVEETYLSGAYLKPEIINNIRKEVKDYVDKCLHSYLDDEINKELRSLIETRIQKLTGSGDASRCKHRTAAGSSAARMDSPQWHQRRHGLALAGGAGIRWGTAGALL